MESRELEREEGQEGDREERAGMYREEAERGRAGGG